MARYKQYESDYEDEFQSSGMDDIEGDTSNEIDPGVELNASAGAMTPNSRLPTATGQPAATSTAIAAAAEQPQSTAPAVSPQTPTSSPLPAPSATRPAASPTPPPVAAAAQAQPHPPSGPHTGPGAHPRITAAQQAPGTPTSHTPSSQPQPLLPPPQLSAAGQAPYEQVPAGSTNYLGQAASSAATLYAPAPTQGEGAPSGVSWHGTPTSSRLPTHSGAGSQEQQVAAVLSTGLEFARAGQVIAQQQAHIDVLTQRLAAAIAARQTAETQLQQVSLDLRSVEERLRATYELRMAEADRDNEVQLAAKTREVTRLTAELARLKDAGPKVKLLSKSEAGVLLSGEELASLKRELAEQETLLKGYQAESEASARRIKELEVALKESSVVQVVSALAHEQRQAHTTGVMASNKDAAARLQELLGLQAQLEALRETSAAREAELKTHVERLRAEKKELEARKGGVDMKQMQEGDALVKQVQAEMESMRAQYTSMVSELQGKLRWYAENQELLTKNDTLVREQQQVIAALEERLALAEVAAGTHGKAGQAKLRELQGQVSALQSALKARVPPNSLAALVAASKPSVEETVAVQALHAKVAALTAQLARKDEDYEVQLRAYQQQYEQLRTRFEEKQASMEGTAKLRKREKELMAQVEELRALHTRKTRDLEAKLKQAQGGRASGVQGFPGAAAAAGGPGRDPGVPMEVYRRKEAEAQRLAAELERTTHQVAELHLRLGEVEAQTLRASATYPSSPSAAAPHTRGQASARSAQLLQPLQASQSPILGGHRAIDPSLAAQDEAAVVILRQRCAALGAEVFRLKQQLADAEQRGVQLSRQQQQQQQQQQQAQQQARQEPPPQVAIPGEMEAAVRRAAAAEMALASVQKAHTEAVERASMLAAEHQRAILSMHDEVVYKEGLRWQERLNAAQMECRAAQDKIHQLELELSTAVSRLLSNWAPGAADFAALERKIDSMAAEQAARDAQWRAVLDDTRDLYAMQAQVSERKSLAAITAKQVELEDLKAQVDQILVSAQRLQAVH